MRPILSLEVETQRSALVPAGAVGAKLALTLFCSTHVLKHLHKHAVGLTAGSAAGKQTVPHRDPAVTSRVEDQNTDGCSLRDLFQQGARNDATPSLGIVDKFGEHSIGRDCRLSIWRDSIMSTAYGRTKILAR